ncbi:MAG: spore germination protein, partial [Clostridia bacterium]|nr:spore germination protein [Clostridia bacterium]
YIFIADIYLNMNNEKLTGKQVINMMALFIIGSSLVTGGAVVAKQDSWISILFAIIMAIPIFLIFARLFKINPTKDIFDIIIEIFGKIAGRVLIILFVFYFFHLGSLVFRNFTEFVQVVSLPETPQFFTAIFMGAVCAYMIKSGIGTMGRLSVLLYPIVAIAMLITVFLSLNRMELSNIKPVFSEGIDKIAAGAYSMLTFPYAEVVLFTTILPYANAKCSSIKIYLSSLFLGGAYLLAGMIRNILILGFPALEVFNFPSYYAIQLINIGYFITRIEVIVSGNYIITGTIKTCVCLYAVVKGLAKLFKINNHKVFVIPITLLMIAYSCLYFKNTMEMYDFIEIYKYYAPVFQIILPIIILIFAEIKYRKNKKPQQQKKMAY